MIEKQDIVQETKSRITIQEEITTPCKTIDELYSAIESNYKVIDRRTVIISDFMLNDDGTISFEDKIKKYVVTEHALKEFCKILKIPYSFATLIDLFLLKLNVDQLKTLKDKEVNCVIVPSILPEHDGIIVNITKNTIDSSEYIFPILNLLSDDSFLSSKNIAFYNAIISYSGFQINVVSTRNNSSDILKLDVKDGNFHTWEYGNSLIGDFYSINKILSMNLFCVNHGTGVCFTTDNRVHSQKYTVVSKRIIEMGDEYHQSLLENIKEDIGIGMNPKTIQEILEYSVNNDLSFFRFSKTFAGLKKLLRGRDKEFIYSLMMTGFEDVQRIESDEESIIEHTIKPQVGTRLQTLGVESCNAYIIFQNILLELNGMQYSEQLILNDIANDIIYDTFECEVKTPKRLSAGVLLT